MSTEKPIPYGVITRAELIEDVTKILNKVHSSTAAQILNKILAFKKHVIPIDDSKDSPFESWERLHAYSELYRRQSSKNVYLFKDLYNRHDEWFPFTFHEVKPITIDLAEYEKYGIEKYLLECGCPITAKDLGNKDMIAMELFRTIVPIASGVI